MSGSDQLRRRFEGRVLGVATMHGKEAAIGPALVASLPLRGYAAIPGLDTDRFGAFSGEVRRTGDPRAACEEKARHGAAAGGLDLVIASEGSFGPYPPAPFVSCDEEWLVLLDARDGMVLAHRHVSLETVFGGEQCSSVAAVTAFAARMRFPAHRLVLKPHATWQTGDRVIKGVGDPEQLQAEAQRMLAALGSVWVEVDLRAMANPTRMRVIQAAAAQFAAELARSCPDCGLFHFAVAEARPGLPCGACGLPTESTLLLRRICRGCGSWRDEPRADGKQQEDPQFCSACNP